MFRWTTGEKNQIEIFADPTECIGYVKINGKAHFITQDKIERCLTYIQERRIFEVCYELYWLMLELKISADDRDVLLNPLNTAKPVTGSGYDDWMQMLEEWRNKQREELEETLNQIPKEPNKPEVKVDDGQFLLF